MLTLEMMAKKARLSYVSALVTARNEAGPAFFASLKGWRDDTSSSMQMDAADPDDDTFCVFAKCLDGGVLKEKEETQQVRQAV